MKKQNDNIEFKTVAIAGMVIVGIVAIVALDKTSYPTQQKTNKKIELTAPPLIFPKNSKSTKKRGKKPK